MMFLSFSYFFIIFFCFFVEVVNFDLLKTGFSIVEAMAAMASGHCGTGPEPRRGRCHGGHVAPSRAGKRLTRQRIDGKCKSYLSCTKLHLNHLKIDLYSLI